MNLYESIANELKAKYDDAYNNYKSYIRDAQKLLNALKDICSLDQYRNENKRTLFRPSAADENFIDVYSNFISEKYPNIIVSSDGSEINSDMWKSLSDLISSTAKSLSMDVNISEPKKIKDEYTDGHLGLEIEITSYTGNANYRRRSKNYW